MGGTSVGWRRRKMKQTGRYSTSNSHVKGKSPVRGRGKALGTEENMVGREEVNTVCGTWLSTKTPTEQKVRHKSSTQPLEEGKNV